jgi:hypothetical protein
MTVTVGEDGTFVAYMAELGIDIKPGTNGHIRRFDDENDGTCFDWRVLNPGFEVRPETNTVSGWEWPSNTEVTIAVDGNNYTQMTNENGDFGREIPFDIQAFDEVQVSVGTAIVKSHIVFPLVLSGYNETADTVSGTTTENSIVNAWACDYDNCDGMQTTSGGEGSFVVNYADIGIDIAPGTNGNVWQQDDDGDGTVIEWRVPSPSFAVDPENDNVWGWEWPTDTEVELLVGGNTYYQTTNENGDFNFDQLGIDIQVGDELQVSGGGRVKNHTVIELGLTGVDKVTNIVSGTATPESYVNVWACDYNNCQSIDVQAGLDGNFTADMSNVGIDITPGTNGNVSRWDEDNDGTIINWWVPNPRFTVNLNQKHI